MVQVLCFSHLAVFVGRHWEVGTACHEIGCEKKRVFQADNQIHLCMHHAFSSYFSLPKTT